MSEPEPMDSLRSKYVKMSIYYLLFFTTVASFAPYFNLFLAARGLSSSQVGLILAVIPLVGMVVQPLWGLLNDRWQIQKTTIFLGLLIPSAVLIWFPLFHAIVLYLLGAGVMAMFQTAMIPMADSMTVQATGAGGYGKVRLFGSLGYAVAVFLAAAIYNRFGIDMVTRVYPAMALLAMVGLLVYPKPRGLKPLARPSAFLGLKKLLRNRRFSLVLLFTLLVTVSQAMNSNFFSLYYQDLHKPLLFLGVIYSFGALSELPFFFIAGRWIEKYGPERILLLGSSVFMLRWIVLAFSPPVWVMFLLQLLHGVSFGLTLAAGVTVASRVSDDSNRVTAQTLYSSVNTGLSAIVGSLVGGVALQFFGPGGIYGVGAVLCLAGIIGLGWLISTAKLREGVEI